MKPLIVFQKYKSLGYLVLWVAMAILSYTKGANSECQIWGTYFWLIDYSEGFIKRGFVGTVLSQLGYTLKSTTWENICHLVVIAHTFLSLALITLFTRLQQQYLFRSQGNSDKGSFILLGCWLVFACTQFWPTLAYNTAYLDVYLLIIFTISFYLFTQGHYLAASILGAIAIFIHESFIFLWSNILVLFAIRPFFQSRQVNIKLLVASLMPVLMIILLLLFHNQEAAIVEISNIPNRIVSQYMKNFLIGALFAQGMVGAFKTMIGIWTSNWAQGWAAFLYYVWPSFLMISSLPFIISGHSKSILRLIIVALVASFLPLSILLFAWDLSRFLVWSNLTAILTLSYFADFFQAPSSKPNAENTIQ